MIFISLAIFLGFTVQTTVGFAAGLVSLPIILFALPLPEAVAVISVFNLSFSILQVWRNRKLIEIGTYKELGAGTAVGVVLGASLLSFGSPDVLKRVLGLFILLYVGWRYWRKKRFNTTKQIGYLLSLVGGFFAGLFSSGAPPFVVYLSNKYEDPAKMRANIIGVLAITNVLRPMVLIYTGVLTWSVFEDSFVAVPGFLLALFLGERVFKNINKDIFLHLVMIFLFISGIAFLVK